MTLPEDAIRALGEVDRDAGWAVVKLLQQLGRTAASDAARPGRQADVELVTVGTRRSLIVVNRTAIPALPDVSMLPLSETHAFLAFAPGRGVGDLELAIIDRLGELNVEPREREGLERMRAQLAAWRRDRSLVFHSRSIVVVERIKRGTPARGGRSQ